MVDSLIVTAFKNTSLDHLKTIEDRSITGGSQWIGNKIPWEVLAVLGWRDYFAGYRFAYRRAHQESCKYFQFVSALPIGYQHIKLLSEFEDLSEIQIVNGKHGTKELVAGNTNFVAETTNNAMLILGPDKQEPNKLVVWTAYPGILTASLESVPCFDGTYESLEAVKVSDYPVAVKPRPNPKRRTLEDWQKIFHTDKPA